MNDIEEKEKLPFCFRHAVSYILIDGMMFVAFNIIHYDGKTNSYKPIRHVLPIVIAQ